MEVQMLTRCVDSSALLDKQVLVLNTGSGTGSRLCLKICGGQEQTRTNQVTYRALGSCQSQKLHISLCFSKFITKYYEEN